MHHCAASESHCINLIVILVCIHNYINTVLYMTVPPQSVTVHQYLAQPVHLWYICHRVHNRVLGNDKPNYELEEYRAIKKYVVR